MRGINILPDSASCIHMMPKSLRNEWLAAKEEEAIETVYIPKLSFLLEDKFKGKGKHYMSLRLYVVLMNMSMMMMTCCKSWEKKTFYDDGIIYVILTAESCLQTLLPTPINL